MQWSFNATQPLKSGTVGGLDSLVPDRGSLADNSVGLAGRLGLPWLLTHVCIDTPWNGLNDENYMCACRQHGMGPVILRQRERMYRMGEHAKPSHVLARLQRHNSL